MARSGLEKVSVATERVTARLLLQAESGNSLFTGFRFFEFIYEFIYIYGRSFWPNLHSAGTLIKITSTQTKNIARIAKRCPEDIASVVKCVKLFLPKVLRKY